MVSRVLRETAGAGLDELTCVCCSCQREKTPTDDWREHRPVVGERVTHGLCPECLDSLYPDIAPLIRTCL